jgi:hypothetical protein
MVDRLQTQLASRSIYDLNPSLLRLVPGQGHKHETSWQQFLISQHHPTYMHTNLVQQATKRMCIISMNCEHAPYIQT